MFTPTAACQTRDMFNVCLLAPRRIVDQRGWFTETYNAQREAALGIRTTFVQDNASMSRAAGTVRGIHFQLPPRAQAKLVRCVRGRILDVVVDLRAGSPTYGHHVQAELSAQDGRQIFIPAGFGHAFVTLEPDTEVNYKVSDFYSPDHDAGLRYDCPRIGIRWPFPAHALTLSDKDKALPSLDEFESPFVYKRDPLNLVALS